MDTRPDLSNRGLHLPRTEDGMCRSEPPLVFSACTALTLGDARDDSVSDTRGILLNSRVNWRLSSSRRLWRVLAGSEGGNPHLVNYVDDVLGRYEICRALDKAPRVPIAAASAVSMFYVRAQVDLLFFG